MEQITNQLNSEGNNSKFGRIISIFTAFMAIITFATAICTPPLSGPFCAGSCFEYPFTDIAGRFPRDYYWMYLAIFLTFSYLIMMIAIVDIAPRNKRVFGMIGVSSAIMATLLLITNYFVQVSVIQPSLLEGETDGISLLTQFNPHGVFIVLEEIGFLLMIVSFFALFPMFRGGTSLERTIKWTAITSFLLAVVSFLLVSIVHGIHREYRFEVIVISIAWLELIFMSFLLARFFGTKANYIE